MTPKHFQKLVWEFYAKNGRALPWRKTKDPYEIFVSEVMLQQTQVERVIPKYGLFIKKFPNVRALAKAPLKEVLLVWQGLGYNRRALSLKRAAEVVVRKHRGIFPSACDELAELPGVGPYTAGAIQAFAFNTPAVFIETNIRSVFLHHFFPNREKVTDKELLPMIEKTSDRRNIREWYYALMDYGSHLKKLHTNPSRRSSHHARQSKFEGSHRQLRAKVLHAVANHGPISHKALAKKIKRTQRDSARALAELMRENFIAKRRGAFVIA